ncbi:hypothetical protein AOCH_002247 [Aspergillus ochraceoroseus]|uniref:Mannosyltransferase n=1 Tax=Aspergillus ochraceoroseus TaxID=138278 RepID=A0A0F8U4U8_9EURO|nr:hypothetical protein AOCH_002247 [Aspergillus ochraceoroseus]
MAPARKQTKGSAESQGEAVSGTKPRTLRPVPFYLPLNITLYVCLVSNGIAAFLAPIQDCDEVFNFWEPTHYLDYGYGFKPGRKVASLAFDKSAGFYIIRLFLAIVCAACQTRLYSAICRTLSPRIGLIFIMIVAFSPGMFHASSSFLPSSFSMYTSMLGLAAFLDWKGGQKTAEGIMWFGLGAIVGWPFAGALVLPLLFEEAVLSFLSANLGKFCFDVFNGGLRCLAILALEVAVDYVFLGKLTVVPWNIVAYNVFGGEGRGPDIFGTEPWTFYIKNLLLNFNVWFIFGIFVGPLLLLQAIFRARSTSLETLLRTVTLIMPFYMWFAIFTVQPHKEERFMYPAYPFLALNAAIAFHMVLAFIGSNNPKELIGRVPAKVKLAAVMSVFEPFEQPGVAHAGDIVCFGKEWYRFPSSFFLPDGMRAKFIRSEFRGLLPGEFPDAPTYSALLEGASRVPEGMNDRNEEDAGKYTDISQCSFLVDSYFPSHEASELEPNYIVFEENGDNIVSYGGVPRTQKPE